KYSFVSQIKKSKATKCTYHKIEQLASLSILNRQHGCWEAIVGCGSVVIEQLGHVWMIDSAHAHNLSLNFGHLVCLKCRKINDLDRHKLASVCMLAQLHPIYHP